MISQLHQTNMAASSLTDVGRMEEEIRSGMETEESSVPENGDKSEETEVSEKTEPETEDTFKKPALFSAPSNKRIAPSASAEASRSENNTNAAADRTGEPAHDDKPVDKCQRQDQNVEKDRRGEVKPKVPSVKAGKFPPIPYTEPPWGGPPPDTPYSLEILKNGTVVDTVPLTNISYIVVGRLPVCNVSLEHPSISRYHAVIQYRGQAGQEGCVGEEKGFYIHDLGSTHGTVVNKNKIPPKTFIRLHVGHVLKFGGSTRLFVLQGPEFDEEEESELTVTELREQARKQRAELEKRMTGDLSDGEEDEEKEGSTKSQRKDEDSGCSWGMDEEAAPEEDENEENPFSTEFQEDQEAAYLKDPKKVLQGFYDREGEELEFEYEDKNHGTWLCRIKLPVDDAKGRQLIAEVTHTGKKKEAAIQCCLEACRMLEARGLLRQEAVSRKRKKKNWEEEDYYDSDDDTFLDRTGTVERKRQERMKKAGKIDERPETFDSLVAKLSAVEKELADTQKKLSSENEGSSASAAEDSLDAFMTAVKSEAAMDAVERRKLHLHVADLRKEAEKLRKLVELTRPAQMPSLLPSGSSEPEKPKKTLPLFGAMKGGSKFKLKTGTIGKLPPKRPNLPAELFNMKELPPGGEEEEEEEAAEINKEDGDEHGVTLSIPGTEDFNASTSEEKSTLKDESLEVKDQIHKPKESDDAEQLVPLSSSSKSSSAAPLKSESKAEGETQPAADPGPRKKKRVMGPSRPPVQLSGQYPEDDPDYSVWLPPAGQTGDGRTHLNDKYGY